MTEEKLTPEEMHRIFPRYKEGVGNDFDDQAPDALVWAVCMAMKPHLWTGSMSLIPWDLDDDEVAFLRAALAAIDTVRSVEKDAR